MRIIKNSYLFILIIGLFLFSGCHILKPRQSVQAQRVEQTSNLIDKKAGQIEDKGRSFLWGAKYSNSHITNREPAVEVSGKMIDLSILAIGLPSTKDAATIEDITDGLISDLQKDRENAEKKLDIEIKKVISLQSEKDNLIQIYEKRVKDAERVNSINAEKAEKWDSENDLLSSLNPFTDLWKFVKKLFVLCIIGGVVILVFNILEIFFPQLKIISAIAGGFIKVVSKILPRAKDAAGLVSDKVYDSLTHVLKANEDVLVELKNAPLEEELLENYPDDYQFNRKNVLEILLKLTDNTIDLFIKNMEKYTNEESRAIIRYNKAESGIKNEKPEIEI